MLLLLTAILNPVFASESGGRIESNLRLGLSDCAESAGCEWLDLGDTAVVGFWTEHAFAGIQARGALDVRLHPAATLEEIEDSESIEAIQPFSLQLQDAWIDLPMGSNATTRWGVQQVSWGVADGVHVSDPISPSNLENPWELDSKLAVPAISVQWGKSQWAIEGVFVPFHTEALLPSSGSAISVPTAELTEIEAFSANELGNVQSRLNTPPPTLSESSGGLHFSLNAARSQLALTLYTGRDTLPQAHGEMLITGFQTDSDRVDFAVPLIYPRIQTAALDYRVELFADISSWVEFAVSNPQRTALTVSSSQMSALEQLGTIEAVPDPLPEYVTQDGEALTRWIVGLDRPFSRVHLSLQWMHGFPTERQQSELSDYVLLYARATLTDVLAVTLQGLSDLEGHLISGALTYLHRDAAELSLSGAWAHAPDGHSLAYFSELSHIGLQAKMVF